VDSGRNYLDVVDPAEVVVVVLGGGRGTRLYPLTRDRAKPAVGFGGKYRLVDIPLSNCLRSGFERIFILTQFNSFSLNRHIWQAYSREVHRNGFIDVVAAEQTTRRQGWFQGPADAVRQSLKYVLYHKPRYVLILSGDQLYRMDYRRLLLWHQARSADVTIAGHYTDAERIEGLGVIGADKSLHVTGFSEKPPSVEEIKDFRVDHTGITGTPEGKPFLASMGIYLFNTKVLLDVLQGDLHDFGKGVIPLAVRRHRVSCFPFDGYWEDVGTIEAFYRANMDWRAGRGIADMFDNDDAIITRARQLPPTRIEGTEIRRSIIAEGSFLHARQIHDSIVGVRSSLGPGSVVRRSILLGNDHPRAKGRFHIGPDCHIERTIVDKNVGGGEGCSIGTVKGVPDRETPLYTIRSGIVVLPRGVVVPAGTRI
jgi:glucose-1-phosphate adenylyltransferase